MTHTWMKSVDSVHQVFLFGGQLGKECWTFKHATFVRGWTVFGPTVENFDLGGSHAECVATNSISLFYIYR